VYRTYSNDSDSNVNEVVINKHMTSHPISLLHHLLNEHHQH